MARAHGRNAQIYIAIASGGTAAPMIHTATWEMSLSTDKVEVTALGDTSKTYVAGLPDGQITFSGFATDTASTSLVVAAIDGVARPFYLYPFATRSTYFWGQAFFDCTTGVDVAGAVTIQGTGAPSIPVTATGF